jgi:hypothetical protein
VEFEWFGPFYAANPEHLGQQSPADVLTMLRRTPDLSCIGLVTTIEGVE